MLLAIASILRNTKWQLMQVLMPIVLQIISSRNSRDKKNHLINKVRIYTRKVRRFTKRIILDVLEFNGMVVPVGPYDGAGWINGWTVPAIFVSLLKGRSLMSSQFWNMMGQPMPS